MKARRLGAAARLGNKLIAVLVAAAMSVPALAGPAEPPNAGAMAADVVVARPLGLVVTTVGVVAFVVSLPFSLLGGNVKEAGQMLVVEPAKETFWRCLGCRSSGRYLDPNAVQDSDM